MNIKWLFALLILLIQFAGAGNRLEKIEHKPGFLLLKFKKPVKKGELKLFTINKNGTIRYVLDFKNCRKACLMRFDRSNEKGKLKDIRLGQYKKNTVRLVIEASDKYPLRYKQIIQSSSPLLKISLPSTPLKALRPLSQSNSRSDGRDTKKPHTIVESLFSFIGIGGSKKSSSKKVKARLLSSTVPRPKKSYRIVIDPGHGGHDSGAVGWRNKMEKRAVLQIARRVKKYLQALGFKVYMTRNSDRFIKLSRRTHYANIVHGDVFVSIHANAVKSRRKFKKVYGIGTYFLTLRREGRAMRVAARENSVVLNKKDRITKAVLLKTIYTGPKIELSHKLALDVHKGILSNLRSKYRGVKDDGVRDAPFWVLVGAEMPAILIETGYITNPTEAQRLFNAKYQDAMARGIAEGISRFLANRERELE